MQKKSADTFNICEDVTVALCVCSCCSNNKFYMLQLIEEAGNYRFFRKWGRVGARNPQVNTHLRLCLCLILARVFWLQTSHYVDDFSAISSGMRRWRTRWRVFSANLPTKPTTSGRCRHHSSSIRPSIGSWVLYLRAFCDGERSPPDSMMMVYDR